MNTITIHKLLARAKYELEKADIKTTTNFEQSISGIVRLHLSDDLPGQNSGWILIYCAFDHFILTFGNLKTWKNFACYASSPRKIISSVHIALSREILNARIQRNKMFNDHTSATLT
jgi:hypothetical protein